MLSSHHQALHVKGLFCGKALHMYPSCLFGDLFVTKNSVGLSLVR